MLTLEYDLNDKFPENSIFCNLSKTYINRVFLCEHYMNCSTSYNDDLNAYCFEQRATKFKCHYSTKMINFYQVCNYKNDCEDSSDEKFCGDTSNYLVEKIHRLRFCMIFKRIDFQLMQIYFFPNIKLNLPIV